MLLEAIYHQPNQNWAYGYNETTIHVRIRTKRNDVDAVEVLFGDKCTSWSRMQTASMSIFASDGLFDYWEASVEPPYKRLCYGFKLENSKQQVWLTEIGMSDKAPTVHLGLFEYPFLNLADIFKPPAWVKDAVFYQLFPERFANGDPANDPADVKPWGGKPEYDNFFGGDLQGVLDHVDYLSELGITAIYFNPIFDAPANHKYDTRDYLKIDPHFGSTETLKALVKACHERGIRIVLDAVFNHCGKTFPPFVDALEKGPDSQYAEWFHVRKWPLQVEDGIPSYETFAFEPIMPKLNTEHPEVKEYLLNVARYWIDEVGIDGWRLDVANEVDRQFWREFRQVVKRSNPDAYILGEVWHDSMRWLQGDQFDAVMNYPLTNAILDFFVFKHTCAKTFADTVGGLLARYPRQTNEVLFNHLDSHDTVRLLTLCKEDKRIMKLALLFQFTFTGAPCIYYGDEIGLTGDFDPDNRKCMEWDPAKQDLEQFDFYQKLIVLRKSHAALRTGSFHFKYAQKDDTLLSYERCEENDHFVILINPDERTRLLSIHLQPGRWKDAFTGQNVSIDDGTYTEKLSPYSFRVLLSVAN